MILSELALQFLQTPTIKLGYSQNYTVLWSVSTTVYTALFSPHSIHLSSPFPSLSSSCVCQVSLSSQKEITTCGQRTFARRAGTRSASSESFLQTKHSPNQVDIQNTITPLHIMVQLINALAYQCSRQEITCILEVSSHLQYVYFCTHTPSTVSAKGVKKITVQGCVTVSCYSCITVTVGRAELQMH